MFLEVSQKNIIIQRFKSNPTFRSFYFNTENSFITLYFRGKTHKTNKNVHDENKETFFLPSIVFFFFGANVGKSFGMQIITILFIIFLQFFWLFFTKGNLSLFHLCLKEVLTVLPLVFTKFIHSCGKLQKYKNSIEILNLRYGKIYRMSRAHGP